MRVKSQFQIGRVAGLLGSVLLHVLLVGSITYGASAAKKRAPDDVGPGAASVGSASETWMTVVLINLPSERSSETLEALASAGAAPLNVAIQVLSPEAAPAIDTTEILVEDDTAEATQSTGNPAVQSMLFGRYTGQIDARIQRAWLKPRSAVIPLPPVTLERASTSNESPVPSENFRCQVRIRQDPRGFVQETELLNCNGTYEWQQSLVNAIQQASPLPAPPNPAVFTQVLVLAFEASSYTPRIAEEGYEPEGYRLAQHERSRNGELHRFSVSPSLQIPKTVQKITSLDPPQ